MQLHLAGVLPGGQGMPPGDLIVQVSERKMGVGCAYPHA